MYFTTYIQRMKTAAVIFLLLLCNVYTGWCELQDRNVIDNDRLLDEKKLSTGCVRSLRLCQKRVQDNETNNNLWALQMLDSTSKTPAGLLSYNFGDMGQFKQCVDINSLQDNIKGKYCLGQVIINSSLTANHTHQNKNQAYLRHLISRMAIGVPMAGLPTWAMCIPDTCTDKDAFYLMSFYQPFGVGIYSVMCQTAKDVYPELTKDAIIGISILSFVVAIVILSTGYDLFCQYKKRSCAHPAFIAFSAYTNGKNLFHITKRTSNISCLDGIRVLSMFWIIMVHTYSVYLSGPIFNLKDVINFSNTVASMVFVNGDLACDTFLLVSGTLVTYVYLMKHKNDDMTTMKMVKHFVHRYNRLTAPMAGVVLVSATLLRYMGSGPRWPYINVFFEGFCKKNWWSALLYIQNELNTDQMCAGHTWYLNVDMQLYIFSPIIFWFLRKYWKTGIALIAFATLSSIAIAFFRSIEDELSGISPSYHSKGASLTYMNDYYLKTETRAAPWLLGNILGYIMTKEGCMDIKLPKKTYIPMWALSFALVVLCTFGGHSTLRGPEYLKFQNAFYIALVRPSFALAMAWMIWACASNHGGIVNRILSLTIFKILNKFIYSMYLLHVTSLYMIVFSIKIPIYFSVFNLAYWYWGIFMFIFGLSIIWILLFEYPFIAIEKIIFSLEANNEKAEKCKLDEKL